ncbi:hypothetical protein EDB84DRAFT_1559028 [Lactarius hengduanensis]|nr:hypothetical protein EDB84DRAFT_1559028 [Lactarius hengduanensis]
MLSSREEIDAINPSNSLGIVGFLEDYPSPADLPVEAFMRKYRSEAEGATFTVTQVNNGGYDPEKPAEESSLDVQYAEAMAYSTPHIFYSTGRGASNTDDWFSRLLPQGASGKYTQDDTASRKTGASLEYSVYVCNLFGQLGLLGVSVLYATCDDGVGKD